MTATDVNPRALRFAAFNARLNGATNVTCRAGSLFEPVAGRRFDLIVANPPYVISPESTLRYRDSGRPRDSLCRALVRQAPRFLREGGWAVTLGQWIGRRQAPWWSPLLPWVEGRGFDAWLLHYRTYDPIGYAAPWNAPSRSADPAAYADALERWAAYYRLERVHAIAGGAILLRRRARGPNWVRADDFPGDPRGPAGEQVLRTARIQDDLVRHATDRALLRARLRLVPDHRLEWTLGAPGRHSGRPRGVLRLDGALPFEAPVDATTLALLVLLDGRRRVADAIAEVAGARRTSPRRLAASRLPAVRTLELSRGEPPVLLLPFVLRPELAHLELGDSELPLELLQVHGGLAHLDLRSDVLDPAQEALLVPPPVSSARAAQASPRRTSASSSAQSPRNRAARTTSAQS